MFDDDGVLWTNLVIKQRQLQIKQPKSKNNSLGREKTTPYSSYEESLKTNQNKVNSKSNHEKT